MYLPFRGGGGEGRKEYHCLGLMPDFNVKLIPLKRFYKTTTFF